MQPLSPDKLFTQMEGVISAPRLSSYLRRAGGDHAKAFSEYQRNIELAEVFYGILQWTEVILRNALHKQLVAYLGSGWCRGGPFDAFEQDSLDKAIKTLGKRKPAWQSGDLISELAFGFWTGILHKDYDVRLWRTCLYLAFNDGGKRPSRQTVFSAFNDLRLLRNRIMHHEPILRWNLQKSFEDAISLVRYVCPPTSDWLRSIYNARVLSALSL